MQVRRSMAELKELAELAALLDQSHYVSVNCRFARGLELELDDLHKALSNPLR